MNSGFVCVIIGPDSDPGVMKSPLDSADTLVAPNAGMSPITIAKTTTNAIVANPKIFPFLLFILSPKDNYYTYYVSFKKN